MKLPTIQLLFASVTLLLLSGCAHNRLSFALDIYGKDPQLFKRLTPQETARFHNKLEEIRKHANEVYLDRSNLSAMMLEAYVAHEETLGAPDPMVKENLQKMLDDHLNLLQKRLTEVLQSTTNADNALDNYSSLKRDTRAKESAIESAQYQAMDALNQVSLKFQEVGKPIDSYFETEMIRNWPRIVAGASEENFQKLLGSRPTPQGSSANTNNPAPGLIRYPQRH